MIYRAFQRLFAGFLLIFSLPIFTILYVIVKLDSEGPFLFLQLRAGRDKKPFWMYKIRTMIQNAESLKSQVSHLNEADGPVFKIKNDPRYTRVGKLLSHIAIDELPQLINILQGSMVFVGPRPLPIQEAQEVPHKYDVRFTVLPGMTSEWIVQGAHAVSFKKWMELDCEYVYSRSIRKDFLILLKTVFLIVRIFIS